MPIYEYRRPDGTTFEIQESFSDPGLTVDPDTGVPVERVLHAPAVHFKGKGFYNTDYGTRNRQREAAENAKSEKGTAEKGDKGSAQKGDKGSAAKGSSEGSSGSGKDSKDSKSTPAKDSKPVTSGKQG